MPRRSKRSSCTCDFKQPKGMLKRRNMNKSKQMKSLKTRLMQISLTADAYIYQAQKLSTTKARDFLQEVTGYKDQCFGDMRTLQVIEKLTSIMKMIIQEECTTDTDSLGEKPEHETDILSNKQMTQDYYPHKEVHKDMYPILKSKSQAQVSVNNHKKHQTQKNAVLIDLTEIEHLRLIDLTDDIEPKLHRKPEASNVLTKALSELSFNDLERQHETCLDENMYSQSILDDFECQVVKSTIDINVFGDYQENANGNTQIDHNDIPSQSLLDDPEVKKIRNTIDKNLSGKQIKNTQKTKINKKVTKNTMIGSLEQNKTIQKQSTEQILSKTGRKQRCKKDIIQKVKPKRNYKRKNNVAKTNISDPSAMSTPAGVVDSTNYSVTNNTTALIVEDHTNNKMKNTAQTHQSKTNKKVILENSSCDTLDINTNHSTHLDIGVENNIDNFKRPFPNDSAINITEKNTNEQYLNNTANKTTITVESVEDLSWIENIKYIRVVEKTEYCSIEGITDSFWDNVCYPDDFDEDDYKF